ncbi:hypothetical protein FDN13_02485 [Caloramator sp. E03]|uniref:hypothetical protein n=1 Tax=Caloramator sp. E03 TaxID=2576307 RepID=UPI0011101C02|nr:hypothetical protein [Caloramator sp. E03]QCX32658.1 hypothetical protein FDN13_02485 [Caloramator sp. E03]
MINIILFKVIKIKINEKNKLRKKNKASKFNVPPKIIIDIAKKSLPSIGYLINKSNINVDFSLTFGFSAPDKTALTYGLINAIIYSFDCFLSNTAKKFYSTYKIVPDLKNEKIELYLDFKIYIKLFFVLAFFFKLLKVLLAYKYYFKIKGGVAYGASN